MRAFFKRCDKIEDTKLLVTANLVVLLSDVFEIYDDLVKFLSGAPQ